MIRKALLDCDRVFERLTRGPFPASVPTDEETLVADHLAACHDCRRLAEALRPAVDLLHEVRSTDEGEDGRGDLPVYLAPVPRGASHRRSFEQHALRWFGQTVALALLATAFAWGGFAAGRLSSDDRDDVRVERTWLASQELPERCRSPRESRHVFGVPTAHAGVSWENVACCTHCHAAHSGAPGPDVASAEALAVLARSCSACHRI